jgi:hypothetical protein
MADVQDHNLVTANRVVDSVGISRRRQNANVGIVGCDADEWMRSQSFDARRKCHLITSAALAEA